MRTLIEIFRTMRPVQWVKNLFVVAPAMFAKAVTAEDPSLFGNAILGMVVFILLSGAVYIWNDVLDVDHDRNHPVRRSRPIASGALSIQAATAGGLAALAAAWGMGYALGPEFTLAATGYLALNVAYGTFLKKVPYLDVISIASGFLLRIVAGCFAVGLLVEEISYYLVLCTFLVALFLALGKRRHELRVLGSDSANHREVLAYYRIGHLDAAMTVVGGLTVIAYAWYTIAPHTVEYFGTMRLAFSTPFVLAGIAWFLMILRRPDEQRSPTDVMVRDPVFVINIGLWAAVVAWAIYW